MLFVKTDQSDDIPGGGVTETVSKNLLTGSATSFLFSSHPGGDYYIRDFSSLLPVCFHRGIETVGCLPD